MNKNKKHVLLCILLLLAISCFYSVTSSYGAGNITITNSSSIKNAINDISSYDTIILENGMYSGNNNTNIVINRNITIIGKYENGAILNGEGKNYFFVIDRWNSVNLINLTFVNGLNRGYPYSSPYLFDGGGAIQNFGELSIKNSYFINNTQSSQSSFLSGGGAIKNDGTLSISNSYFINNHGLNGGAILNFGKLDINQSVFTNNRANSNGNDIYNSWWTEMGYPIGGIGPTIVVSNVC